MRLVGRRGRLMLLNNIGQADPLAQLRTALGDANLVGIWWGRSGVTSSGGVASNVADARGAGFGGAFTAAGTAQPSYNPATGLFTFNGTTNALQNNDPALTTITGDGAMFFIGTLGAATAADQRMAELGDTAGASGNGILILVEIATSGIIDAQAGTTVATALAVTNYPGVRVFHGRHQNVGGGNIRAGVQVGKAAEVTSTAAGVDRTVARIVVGASRSAASNFAACSALAWGVYKGNATAATRDAINRFAQSLGATL